MFYVLRPQSPYSLVREHPVYVDPEDAYVERKRREYLAALQQQQERRAYEQAVAAEAERHRARLAALAHQERMRRNAAHRRSLPPHAFACAGPSCAPTDIVRGRYNRQREAPHFHAPAPAPAPHHQHPQGEHFTLDQLFTELFGHSVHNESEVSTSKASSARKSNKPAAIPQQVPRANPASVPVASTSTAPAPAVPSVPADPTEGHWSNAVERTRSVAAISQISRTFESLQRTFTFPAGPLAPIPGSEAPRLAYNSTNAPIHAYEHALSELLTKLDAVESFGFRGVRELRKEVVVKIEKELEALEKKVAEAIAAGASPVIKSTEPLSEEPAVEKQVEIEDKAAEDTVMEEAEVAAVVASDNAEETAEGYDLDIDDTATVVPSAPAVVPTPVEATPIADSPVVDSEVQTVTVEPAQSQIDALALDIIPAEPAPLEPASAKPSSAQPEEDAIEADSRDIVLQPIITEPAVEAGTTTESVTPAELVSSGIVATSILPEPGSQTVLGDATASSSESESEIEDAVDVTVSSDSDVEVTLEAEDVPSDAEKEFEML